LSGTSEPATASLEQGRNTDFMCGICGIIGGDRRQVEPATRAMMRAMIHRGPDDEGYEELPLGSDDAGTVAAFGFRRLAILDLSPAGHQPMFNERTGDCIVFNGEIYNFRQLRAELQADGARFHSSSDTEVLLQALSVWGEQAIGKLQGMYAFAFYQAATRRILFARDPSASNRCTWLVSRTGWCSQAKSGRFSHLDLCPGTSISAESRRCSPMVRCRTRTRCTGTSGRFPPGTFSGWMKRRWPMATSTR